MLSRKRHKAVKKQLINPKHINFLKEVSIGFNPKAYKDISIRLLGDSFKHFLLMMVVLSVISFLFFIPKIIGLPDYVEKKIDSFEELKFDITFKSDSPVTFGEKFPLAVLDSSSEEATQGKERLLLTPEKLNYRFLMDKNEVALEDYKDIKQNSEGYGEMAYYLVLIMLPALAVIGFLYFTAKYLIIIFVFGLAGLIITRIARFDIELIELLNIGFYAAAPMAILEMIPLGMTNINLSFIPLIIFILYFALGTLVAGSFEKTDEQKDKTHKKIKRKEDDYVDIRNID